ncbi:hypothetical protein M378DRAFT_174100 [Amanita muscaria Koide BX008]|uniref:Uncharacterized protein n=1 Tax=Amanita muscaria (strain Koide BX008) TaxID=946122 RepID=A0A0C2SLF4_AMAMK|nr:hypothetical protein M378DRAFT_174100 [Amanita muscaria Koide BX008]
MTLRRSVVWQPKVLDTRPSPGQLFSAGFPLSGRHRYLEKTVARKECNNMQYDDIERESILEQ